MELVPSDSRAGKNAVSAAGKSNLNSRGEHRCRERGQEKQVVAPVPRLDPPASAESPAGAVSQRADPVLPWGGQCSTPIGAAFGWPPSNEPVHMGLRDSSQIMTDALACKNATLGAREYSTRIEVQPEPYWGRSAPGLRAPRCGLGLPSQMVSRAAAATSRPSRLKATASLMVPAPSHSSRLAPARHPLYRLASPGGHGKIRGG